MSSFRGWYPRHRSILSLLDSGELTLLDSAIEDFLYLIADYRSGLSKASAEKIRACCPRGIDLRAIQRSLSRLEALGRIKRYQLRGRRGNYPVVLCHYFVREASGKWKRVNGDKTKTWREIAYDYVDDPSSLPPEVVTRRGTEASLNADGGDTRLGSEVTPIQEGETKSDKETQEDKTDFEVDGENESERVTSLEKSPAETADAATDAFATWDLPADGVLRIGPDLLESLHVDRERLRQDDKSARATENMLKAWDQSWSRISTAGGVIAFIDRAEEASKRTKMWLDPVFFLRRGQIQRGELKVQQGTRGA